MTTVGSIYQIVDAIAPFSLAMGFDNPGLIIGNGADEVSDVLLCLDVTPAVIEEAVKTGAQLILSHHPLMFSPIKHVVEGEGEGSLIRSLIKNDISLIAVHTNYDTVKDGLNWQLAHQMGVSDLTPLEGDGIRDVLIRAHGVAPLWFSAYAPKDVYLEGDVTCAVLPGLSGKRAAQELKQKAIRHSVLALNSEGAFGYGLIGNIAPIKASELAKTTKKLLNATCVKYTGEGEKTIRRLAIACGSGKSVFDAAIRMGADGVITGEVSYDTALMYTHKGLSIFEAGHFDTEKWFMASMAQRLQIEFGKLQCNVRVHISNMSKDVYSGAV
ncbi:MAG: Nif3-like dinuclear metal center hexameric protein [Clostridiales bacterium]|nr:Nif3-like dinuclear metal center hexameric protein [Clostridiales bacterium]